MSYIISFWNKSRIQISNEAAETLKQAISSESIKTFEIGKNLYAVSSVEMIIEKEEAWRVFSEAWQELKNLEDSQLSNDLKTLEAPKELLNKKQ